MYYIKHITYKYNNYNDILLRYCLCLTNYVQRIQSSHRKGVEYIMLVTRDNIVI